MAQPFSAASIFFGIIIFVVLSILTLVVDKTMRSNKIRKDTGINNRKHQVEEEITKEQVGTLSKGNEAIIGSRTL